VSIESWIAFCITEAILCFTPGPAVLLVASVALGRGMRSGLGAIYGIIAANTLYFALSAAGIGALLLASRELFLVLKWVGASYLVWLGVRMIVVGGGGRSDAPHDTSGRAFLRGFVVQGANPKAIVFFVAFLPQFLDPAQPLGPQLVILAASSVVIEFAALVSYAHAAASAGRHVGPRVVRALERIGGGLLIGAGVRLAAIRQG
jgi:threonine/homoserine/homoserine lactone efflux protein